MLFQVAPPEVEGVGGRFLARGGFPRRFGCFRDLTVSGHIPGRRSRSGGAGQFGQVHGERAFRAESAGDEAPKAEGTGQFVGGAFSAEEDQDFAEQEGLGAPQRAAPRADCALGVCPRAGTEGFGHLSPFLSWGIFRGVPSVKNADIVVQKEAVSQMIRPVNPYFLSPHFLKARSAMLDACRRVIQFQETREEAEASLDAHLAGAAPFAPGGKAGGKGGFTVAKYATSGALTPGRGTTPPAMSWPEVTAGTTAPSAGSPAGAVPGGVTFGISPGVPPRSPTSKRQAEQAPKSPATEGPKGKAEPATEAPKGEAEPAAEAPKGKTEVPPQ